MAMTKAALLAELQADPATLGYAALVAANNDTALAALLNDKTLGGSIARVSGTVKEITMYQVTRQWHFDAFSDPGSIGVHSPFERIEPVR